MVTVLNMYIWWNVDYFVCVLDVFCMCVCEYVYKKRVMVCFFFESVEQFRVHLPALQTLKQPWLAPSPSTYKSDTSFDHHCITNGVQFYIILPVFLLIYYRVNCFGLNICLCQRCCIEQLFSSWVTQILGLFNLYFRNGCHIGSPAFSLFFIFFLLYFFSGVQGAYGLYIAAYSAPPPMLLRYLRLIAVNGSRGTAKYY